MNDEARTIVNALGLEPHPEGGYYRETFRALCLVQAPQGERAASTVIYYLLPAGTFSAFHRVRSDEHWHHYDGDPVELHTIDPDGAHAVALLGRDFARGERPQSTVRAGVWQAALPIGSRFALCGCTVAPGFEFGDFEMPSRAELQAALPNHHALVARLTRD
jgi:hypothetical protein